MHCAGVYGPELPRQCLSPVLQHNGQVPQSADHQEESIPGGGKENKRILLKDNVKDEIDSCMLTQ